jgi:hypothetical protein
MRDLIFVSHATPEDNDFALWISLQLAKHGYRVWCDQTDLLGGERFYDDIDTAIGEHAIKFLFVLSRTSHDPKRRGPHEELIKAKNVERLEEIEDFIIPLSIDGVAHKAKHIVFADRNSIPFEEGWADGLRRLLQKLEKDTVPKNGNFNPEAVSTWWRNHANAEQGVKQQPETLFSNWFLFEEFPKITTYRLTRYRTGGPSKPSFPFPAVEIEPNRWATFAKPDTFTRHLQGVWELADVDEYVTTNWVDGISERDNRELTFGVRRNAVSQLLNEAWLQMVRAKELPLHELANRNQCLYFPSDFCEKDKIFFQNLSSERIYRTVSGKYKMLGFWHFGIQAKPLLRVQENVFGFIIKPHVVFSSDGKTLWTDDKKMHRARRGKCKSWWNAEWRDHIIAAMSFLADGGMTITVPLSPDNGVVISSRPYSIEVPVTFDDPPPKAQNGTTGLGDEDSEEDDDDDDWDDLEDSLSTDSSGEEAADV